MRQAKRQSSRWLEDDEGFIRGFLHIKSICFCFSNHRIHTASRLLDAAVRIHFDYATCKKKQKTNQKTGDSSCATARRGSRRQAEHRDEGTRWSNEASGETVQGSWRRVDGGGEVMEGVRILPPVNNECCFYILLTRPGLPPCIDPPHAISARIQLNGKVGGRSDAAPSASRHTSRHVTARLHDIQALYSASSTGCRVKAMDSAVSEPR